VIYTKRKSVVPVMSNRDGSARTSWEVLVLRGSPGRGIAMGCAMMNASIASGIGKAMKPNKPEESKVGQESRYNTRLSDGDHGVDAEEVCCNTSKRLDPQFAEPAHVHPTCPIAHPFTVCVCTCTWVTTLGGGGGTRAGAKPSTWDHDLPCATALPR